MSNELTLTNTALLPSQQEFSMFQVIAKNAQTSGLYGGVGGEAKIFMILLAARELGIPPMQALNGSLWNIQGKIEISARCMNAMIRRAGHSMKITSTDKECTIVGKRADTGEEHTEVFTWAMGEKAGLTNGNVWKKYPEDMLYNRCMSRFARRFCPDVIGNAYVEGEISEAKQAERLEQADCEITNTNENICPTPSQENSEEVAKTPIDQESYKLLMKALESVSEDNARLFLKTMRAKHGIINPIEMPQADFEKAISWLRANEEKKEVE